MKKRIRLMGVVLASTLLLAGCGSSYNGAKYDTAATATATESYAAEEYAYDSYDYSDGGSVNSYDEISSMKETSESAPQAKDPSKNRKLIRTVNLSVETKEFDLLIDKLQNDTLSMGGYVESSNISNNSYNGYKSARSAYMTLRVPKEQLDFFLNEVSNICNVVNRNENVEDVTLTYVDLESHKKALEAEQTRLLQFLEEAQTIEDMLYIEERLTNVRYQLQSMESQLRTFDDKVDYATVTVNVSEVKELTVVEPEEKTVWDRISEGFIDSVTTVWDGLVDFFVWFVVNIPFLLVWAVVIFVIVVILRALFGGKAAAKRAQKKAAKLQKKAEKAQAKAATKQDNVDMVQDAKRSLKNAKENKEFPIERVSEPGAELTTAAENAKKQNEES